MTVKYCHCEGPDTRPHQDLPHFPSLLSKRYGLPCERSFDTHTHTQYKHTLGTFFITVLNRQLCIFLSAYIPRFGAGVVVM